MVGTSRKRVPAKQKCEELSCYKLTIKVAIPEESEIGEAERNRIFILKLHGEHVIGYNVVICEPVKCRPCVQDKRNFAIPVSNEAVKVSIAVPIVTVRCCMREIGL